VSGKHQIKSDTVNQKANEILTRPAMPFGNGKKYFGDCFQFSIVSIQKITPPLETLNSII